MSVAAMQLAPVLLSDPPKWTDVITAWATFGAGVATTAAVVSALWIAIHGARHADKQLSADRKRADRERRVDRNTALLLEVYDLYAAWTHARDSATKIKLRTRLAVQPVSVATTIRLEVGEQLFPGPRMKQEWLTESIRASSGVDEARWAFVEAEFVADLWYISNDKPEKADQAENPGCWWDIYDPAYVRQA